MTIARPIELLSPAKDLECGMAAINAGADAVYIGGPAFGAREAASNSITDLEKLARYAHIFGAKVYVTLNTILFDNELEEARKMTYRLSDAGIDALIVQDMAFVLMDLPPIPLHASTQTNNYDLEKIKFLDKTGFNRIVLARELTITQITEVRRNITSQIECFVHGSLCVSLSGQCYLSYAIGGRSANRGACAQPCRKRYNLIDTTGKKIITGKHLLSLKDLNLSDYIKEIADAGADSLKIEGRLKDMTYVKNITAFYRSKLDAVIEGNSSYRKASAGRVILDFSPDPARSFSRGPTDYFLHGRKKDIVSHDTPKSMGEDIGKVTETGHDWFVVDTDKTLANNDGLVFINRQGESAGLKVNQVSGKRIYPGSMNGIFAGAMVYRNYDHIFHKQMIAESAIRKLNVKIALSIKDNCIIARAISETDVISEMAFNTSFSTANSCERSYEMIKKQMAKSGNTPFDVIEVDTGGCEKFFFTPSFLNNIRRELLESLRTKLEEPEHNAQVFSARRVQYPYKTAGFEANISNAVAKRFYEESGVEAGEAAVESSADTKGKRVMTTKYCIKYHLGQCTKTKGDKTENSSTLFLVDDKVRLRLEFDCRNCFMNVYMEQDK